MVTKQFRRFIQIASTLLVSFFILAFPTYAGIPKKYIQKSILFPQSMVTVRAEVADTSEKRSQGLMLRSFLSDKEAMIFCFNESSYLEFWMFNTSIPLTIIFLNNQKKIVDIQDMRPCREMNPDLCITYRSREPAKYAIELNQGFDRKYGIKVGHKVIIKKHK
jgi:uncharacterized protein